MCSELNICLGSYSVKIGFNIFLGMMGGLMRGRIWSVQWYNRVIAQHCQQSLQVQKGFFHRAMNYQLMNYQLVLSISFQLSFKLMICVGALMVLLVTYNTEKSCLLGSCIDSGD